MKRIVGILLVLLLCATALAEGPQTLVTPGTIETDGNLHAFTLEAGTYCRFPISLPSNGRLELVVQCALSGGNGYEVRLADRNLDTLDKAEGNASGVAYPDVFSFVYDLPAGDYYAMVGPESYGKQDVKGSVNIRATFTPSAAGDNRQDDTFASATEYTEEPIMGFLSSPWIAKTRGFMLPEDTRDARDYYWLQSQGGSYTINLTPASPEGEFKCVVYDEYYNQLAKKEENLFTLELPAGKVYVMVEPDFYLAGDYLLRVLPE